MIRSAFKSYFFTELPDYKWEEAADYIEAWLRNKGKIDTGTEFA
jgi:hypothetical protein